jgi:hypothetical protein
MLDLSEKIREYVDTASPTVTIEEIERYLDHRPHETLPRRHPVGVHHRATLLSAAAIVVLVLLVQFLPGTGPTGDADAALTHVAAVAAARPAGVAPGRGQYLYYETTQLLQGLGPPAPAGVRQFLFEVTETTQTWVTPRGSGRQRIVIGQPKLVFPRDKEAWKAAGSPSGFHPVGADILYPSTQMPDGGPLRASDGKYYLSYLNSSKFPTQPAALQKYMDSFFKITGGPATTFLLAGDALQVGASPTLRAALFKLIEHLHGVVLLGPTKDSLGRTGTGVAIDGYGNRYILVFNPTTSAVLGEEIVSAKSATHAGQVIPKGTLVGSMTFGTTGIAASTTTYPDGRSAPPYRAHVSSGTSSGTMFITGPPGWF